ncbi:uncharacterized protein METZ01_LOCUS1674 [marine metagenome]|uniref:Uncharacterized protein n=1 Tax=marine metagenome TaxID=408172 RepID=A0A381N2H7_9ZZZZ
MEFLLGIINGNIGAGYEFFPPTLECLAMVEIISENLPVNGFQKGSTSFIQINRSCRLEANKATFCPVIQFGQYRRSCCDPAI